MIHIFMARKLKLFAVVSVESDDDRPKVVMQAPNGVDLMMHDCH
jgi:hypothetical protein